MHIENEFDDLTKSPIIKAMNFGENIIITPHVGGMTIEGQTKAHTHTPVVATGTPRLVPNGTSGLA